jgi:acetylornithine deacetylase/succinyl-diaminopimelate desuccinylase-like protein
VIPDLVVVAVDWRTLPGADRRSLLGRVKAHVEARVGRPPPGLTWEVRLARERQRTYTAWEEEVDLHTPGFLMDREHPVVRAAARAAGRRVGAGPAAVRAWGFATDGGWSCGVHGIPTVGFAPGEERFAHTNRERLEVEEARWAFARYPGLIVAIQRALGS